jgi:SAM-dependent methyltransferase
MAVMTEQPFYADEQAAIHHERFGTLAARAAAHVAVGLRGAGLTRGTWVDLGCGSGILAREATGFGYDVVGVDISASMVALARVEAPDATFLAGSAFDVDLPPAVAVTAVGEVLGYAADATAGPDRLGELAHRVRAALEPGGRFVFDLAGPGRNGPDRRLMRVHEGAGWLLAMIADEDEARTRLDRRISIFSGPAPGGTWRRTDEHHVLRLLAPDDVVPLLVGAGFEVTVRPDYGDGPGLAGWAVFEATAR